MTSRDMNMIPSDLGPREPTTQVKFKDKTYNVRADLLAGDLVVCDHDSEIEDTGNRGVVELGDKSGFRWCRFQRRRSVKALRWVTWWCLCQS